jgi:APA family basic amino acid/polyamine antiporter
MPASLRRELTVTSATALVISNMIGTGIFTTTGFLAGDLGRPSLVLGIWIVGGLVALAGCLSYAELGMNLPRSGGEYVYLREAWGPIWGFLSGWVSFFAGFAAPIAAGALAISEYLGRLLPLAATESTPAAWGFLNLGWPQIIGVGVISALAVVNILGVGLAAKLQNVLTAVKLGVIAAFLLGAFTVGNGQWAHLADSAVRTSPHGIPAQFAISLIFVMFAYSGWNAASYVAEEMKSPESTLPRVLLIGTALVAVLYLALNLAYVYALPLESLKGVIPVGAASATAMFGGRAGNFFAGMITLGLLSTVSAMSLVGPRVYFAMARDGCFPAGAARVHPRWGTPVQAIVYQTVASAIMILTGTFEALVYYIGFTLILFSALAVAGLMRLRSRPQWRRLPVVDRFYPVIPAAFLTASAWMLAWTLVGQPRASALGLLTVAAGGLLYRFLPSSKLSGTSSPDSR